MQLNEMKTPALALLCAVLLPGTVTTAAAEEVADQVSLSKYQVEATGNQVWVYLPTDAPADQPLTTVLIAVAGTPMIHGLELADGDSVEHIPYAQAGFAVVAYGLTGPVEDDASDASYVESIESYVEREGGLLDAVDALKLATEKHPAVGAGPVFVAGHSSAGLIALNLARRSRNFAGCIAYAAPTNLENEVDPDLAEALQKYIPGFRKFVIENSPVRNAAQINCPVFFFNALDDSRVPPQSVAVYLKTLKAAGKPLNHLQVETGGHYNSMIEQGIPAGIEWIQAQLKISRDSAADGQ